MPAAVVTGASRVVGRGVAIALADAGRAREMQQQLAGAGIKSYTEVVKISKGEVTRVRAGPYATREAAEKSLAQIKALGLSGNITSR